MYLSFMRKCFIRNFNVKKNIILNILKNIKQNLDATKRFNSKCFKSIENFPCLFIIILVYLLIFNEIEDFKNFSFFYIVPMRNSQRSDMWHV